LVELVQSTVAAVVGAFCMSTDDQSRPAGRLTDAATVVNPTALQATWPSS